MRSVKRFLVSMVRLAWYLACSAVAAAFIVGPPLLILYVIAHFLIKYW